MVEKEVNKDISKNALIMKIKEFLEIFKTFFGTKRKVNLINKDSIRQARYNKKELTILFHGVAANYYSSVYPVILWLKKRGIQVVSIGYDDGKKIESSALKIKRKIDRIMKKARVKKINIIGISLGGVVARYYIEELGQKNKINKLITIFAPVTDVKNKISVMFNSLIGGNPENVNYVNKKMRGKFSVKKHLAIYGKNDEIIGKQYPIKNIPKYVKEVPFNGDHMFIAFNMGVMKLALDYLNEN